LIHGNSAQHNYVRSDSGKKKARIAAVAAALRTNGPQADHLSASNSSIET
jgi:hypothetical protein